jgi:hypothetical protein
MYFRFQLFFYIFAINFLDKMIGQSCKKKKINDDTSDTHTQYSLCTVYSYMQIAACSCMAGCGTHPDPAIRAWVFVHRAGEDQGR